MDKHATRTPGKLSFNLRFEMTVPGADEDADAWAEEAVTELQRVLRAKLAKAFNAMNEQYKKGDFRREGDEIVIYTELE